MILKVHVINYANINYVIIGGCLNTDLNKGDYLHFQVVNEFVVSEGLSL